MRIGLIGTWLSASALFAASTAAMAQLNPNPTAGPIRHVDPEPLKPEQRITPIWHEGNDPKVFRPSLPPMDISKIPPMPISVPEHRRTPRIDAPDDSVTLYDAETNQAYKIPLGSPGAVNGLSEAPYTGIGPVELEGERTDWTATMAAVSGATLTTYPARANVKLIMRFVDVNGANQYFVCSGSMQDPGVVLTAAHCVYGRAGKNGAADIYAYASEIWVIPAWDGVGNNDGGGLNSSSDILNNYGWAYSTQYIAGTAYVNNGDFDRDCAAIRLNRTVTRSVGMMTGWYGWSYGNCSTSTTHYNYSYPAETCNASGTLHTGRQMYLWSDQPDGCPGLFDNQYNLNTTGGCFNAVWGGMSGSALYYISNGSRFVGATSSTSDRATNASYCGLWDQFTTDLETFKTGTRGSTFDVEALNYNAGTGTPNVAQGDQIPAGQVLITNATNGNGGTRNITLRVYLSTNTDISSADTLLATYTYNNINFPAMTSIYFNIPATTIPFGTPTGLHYAGIIIDSATDGNSSNNETDLWDAQPVNVISCSTPSFVSNASATDRAYCDRVRISWSALATADTYKVWRNTVNNYLTSTLLGTTASTLFDDFGASATGTQYYYWVEGINGCGSGSYTAAGQGSRASAMSVGPTNVQASDATSCSEVTVTWTAAAGATSYQIWRNTSNTTLGSTQIASLATSPYSDTTALNGVVYYYFVRGNNPCGVSPFAASTVGSRQILPVAVTGLTMSNNLCAGIQLNWNAISNAHSYNIWRNTSATLATAILIGSSNNNSFLDTTAVAGTSYFYWITAVNECGSGPFANVRVSFGVRLGAPAIPTGVSASDGTACAPNIVITWAASPNATNYQVWRSSFNSTAFASLIATVSGTTYTDTTAAPNATYYYFIRSMNSCNNVSGYSTSDSGTRGGAPNAPTAVAATDGTTCNSVSISWTPAAGATAYQVYRNTVNSFATAVPSGGSINSPYIDNTAVTGTTYYYWVASVSVCGNSAPSTSDSGFAGASVLFSQIPADLSIIEGQTATFSVQVGGATAYLWRRNGSPLSDGGNISGATTATLTIDPASASDAGSYDCRVTSPCGTRFSPPGILTVNPVPCPADFNQDGGVDGSDVNAFYAAWESGDASADVNYDGGVDGADVDAFFVAWEAGGC
jgi:fibronectin type 3 domain-containing protein